MRKHLFAVLAALAAGVALAFTPQAYTNSFERGGVTYVQRGGLGTKDYVVTNVDMSAFVSGVSSVNSKTGAVVLVASDVQALPDNYTALTNNSNFKTAVEKVSPPVELPSKWALANVTNATGGAVTAANVGAVSLSGDSSISGNITANSMTALAADHSTKYGASTIYRNYQRGEDATINLPNASGTLALTSQIPSVPSKWAFANVTNAAGSSVNAADVGALTRSDADERYDALFAEATADLKGGIRLGRGLYPVLHKNTGLSIYYTQYRFCQLKIGSVSHQCYISEYDAQNWNTKGIGAIYQSVGTYPNNYMRPYQGARIVISATTPIGITVYFGTTPYELEIGDSTLQSSNACRVVEPSIFDTFSPSMGYAFGQTCLKDGKLYRCVVSNYYSGKTWSDSDWAEIAVEPSNGVTATDGELYANGSSLTINSRIELLTTHKQNIIQISTPSGMNGSDRTYDDFIQYTGTSTAQFKQGHFYKMVTFTPRAWQEVETMSINGYPSYQDVTNTVNAVKAEFYDAPLQVNWTMRMVNGEMKLYATTNVNMSTL